MQSIARDGHLPRSEQRTEASVAEALVQQLEQAQRDASFAQRPCRVGRLRGRCVAGRDAAVARSGVVLALGDRIVWLDFVGPVGRSGELEAEAGRIFGTLAVEVRS